ncbi:hypothetical protein [Halostagnicola sp. A-GB9-2]|uniref:hypothetical protein n=1 Tax=Halostagnicola sp. A-GB9-2 TaxID=3048066 RepID=UPI0024C06579|nr:hypothetical protein [Halostagnicola sp. A-GB9-2]MDJ1432501.1 hypothetical protein [Halostagnicola sp. A-GB9-2]
MIEIGAALTEVVLQNGAVEESPFLTDYGAAAIAVGLAALASGYAERGIGAAAVGAVAEDRDMLIPGIILTVLPETLVIFALLIVILAL